MNIPDLFLQVGVRKVIVTSLTRNESKNYSAALDIRIKAQSKLVITQNGFQHLLDSGHITGIGKNCRYDINPLTFQDFKNLKIIFKKPDQILKEKSHQPGVRVVIVKTIMSKQYCLVANYSNEGTFKLITFYKTNGALLNRESSRS